MLLSQCCSTGNAVPYKSDGEALLERSQCFPDVQPSEAKIDEIRKLRVEPKWCKESKLLMSFQTKDMTRREFIAEDALRRSIVFEQSTAH